MVDTRDSLHVFASCAASTFFAVVAYWQYGYVIHRSTWDRQRMYLPILFLLFPEIFICQVVMNIVLVVQRYMGMRKIGISMQKEGFWFYVASILDLHSKNREFNHGAWTLGAGGGHAQKSEGNWRLSTLNSSRLSFENKYKTNFDGAKFIAQLIATLFFIYQGVSASITYIGRILLINSGTLSIDHFTGIYAICGTVLELATLILIFQPYEWTDNNEYIEKERLAMPDVDTSNAWVYEGFLALTVHGLLWISLRSWIYISTLRKLGESPKAIAYDKFALFMANFSETGITTLVLILVIGVPLMVPTVWEVVSKPNRQGFVWLAKKVKISYYAGGVCFRLLLAVISVVVTAMIWTHAIREVMSVGNGQTQLWNEAWKVPNPSADTIYGVILSLWS